MGSHLGDIDMNNAKVLTNSFLVTNGRILLGMKKRGFGMNKYNGFGGKVDEGESILQGAQREFSEEAGITMVDPEYLAEIIYTYEGMDKAMLVHVYRATEWQGEIVETEEMKPEWFDCDKVPYENMWADDIHWYSLLFDGTPFTARFDFASDMTTILRKTVTRTN
eukprot:CAMPEP_0203793322 /NCGR_PEP_ID=MMETSP0100_2-20121128/5792_1 /ASSEMBLY_ACC=CAM_ASM_000210 /TAXON_ID=96639 /ORGANISM=" , Strain NY0313808BC1" /LENGTH=164 /DNA_ID=CAMNT_0050697071 /DNA_START=149 /DNA_END=643 /DNA_ORIENTATION=-